MRDFLQDAADMLEFFERTKATRQSQAVALAAALEKAYTEGVSPADARAIYAALRNIAWPANEIEQASAKLKAVAESDGFAVWDSRRSGNRGPERGWMRPGKPTT